MHYRESVGRAVTSAPHPSVLAVSCGALGTVHPTCCVSSMLQTSQYAVVLGLLCVLDLFPARTWPALPAPAHVSERPVYAAYAGSENCRRCHEEAYTLWAGSNHRFAERPLQADRDRAAFAPARAFKHGSQQTQVRLDGTNHSVTCVGLTRSNETHAAARVIGHQPLRQFLVPAPGGRWQVLEAAYDPVTNEWFNVYGTEDRQPGEWGHWTGRGMNWNSMCAGCHNTRFRKNYDAATDSYRTVMAEPAVGCEACHGPLQAHLDWQARFGASGRPDPTVPRLDRALVLDYCGFCHARRTDLTGDFKPGDRFGEHHDLVIPDTTDTYYPDGQVRDEDFEYAAFLGSRMHTNDVHCLDCHEPHSAKTRLPGNWLCLRCHNGGHPNAPVIQPVEHAHHKVRGFGADGQAIDFDLTSYNPRSITETGGECVNCHLPQTVYMQRHRRHDHGLTSPDPLLTRQFGIPNACNRCHLDKTVDWSVEWCDKWYGTRMDRPARARTQWIARARAGDTAARGPLVSLLEGNDSPYWKAVAARLLVRWARDPAVTAALLRSTAHPDPLVRVSAARALTPLMDLPDAPAGLRLRRLL